MGTLHFISPAKVMSNISFPGGPQFPTPITLPSNTKSRTLDPIVTGTSILALKYAGGVLLAADTLASYGSLARFTDVNRFHKVNETTVIGAGGELSDFQFLQSFLDSRVIEDESQNDGHHLSPSDVHNLITRVYYNRRSRFNPLWNSIVVAGHKNGKSYLGFVDLVGTSFTDNFVATGMGSYLALPILREAYREDLTFEEARKILVSAMQVLFYRDCRTINKIRIARVDESGVSVEEPHFMETNWSIA
eukprot:c4378_g1_i1.p1 GENE.c4378_g1_i1~~c4378_g1_i1.p1  ORF type:complete len:248 (+),score=38.16 c4378_g1_i1:1-744(+)